MIVGGTEEAEEAVDVVVAEEEVVEVVVVAEEEATEEVANDTVVAGLKLVVFCKEPSVVCVSNATSPDNSGSFC